MALALRSLAPPPGAAPSRRLVVVVRLPRGEASRSLPAVVHSGADAAVAERIAQGLRRVGVEVVRLDLDEAARGLCTRHAGQLAAGACVDCGTPVCACCRLDAGGDERCAGCHRRRSRARRDLHLRRMFAVLAFVAFLHQVHGWMGRERALLDPLGPVDVAFIQLVRPEAAGTPLVRLVSSDDPKLGLPAVQRWFDAEHERYTDRAGPYLQAHVFGPFVGEVTPPGAPDADVGWLEMLRVAFAFPRYFHDRARSHGIDPDEFGARVYLVYGKDRGDLSADSRGSRKGRIAVSFIPVDTASVAYAHVTVAHELAHVLGAEDLYRPDDYTAELPRGLVEPHARPIYPQRYAELMAVDIPTGPGREREVNSLDEVRVGHASAAAMGWIDPEIAAAFYAPRATLPEDRLPPAAPSIAPVGAAGTAPDTLTE